MQARRRRQFPVFLEGEGELRLRQVLRRHVIHVLDACKSDRESAAAVLGISRRTLNRMLRRWWPKGLPKRARPSSLSRVPAMSSSTAF